MSGLAETLCVKVRMARDGFCLRVDATLALDGVTAVFGPSGSGKTTLLRAIAGLDRPDHGRIALDEEVWFDADSRKFVSPHRRGAGYMFQDARLFSHLDVRGNLTFSDRRSRDGGAAVSFDEAVEAAGLAGLLDRSIGGLSGGERQRVALARTLLARPRLLLLDEPLTGLDRAAKREILPYLRDVPARFGIPALFVSHDIEEVSALASRMLVLRDGELIAHGPLSEVMQTLDLAPLMADGTTGSLVEAVVTGHDEGLGLTHLAFAGTSLSLPLDMRLAVGAGVRLFVDARDVALATVRPEGISIRNIVAGKITQIVADRSGPHADVTVSAGPSRIKARITRAALAGLELKEGQEVFALVKAMSLAA